MFAPASVPLDDQIPALLFASSGKIPRVVDDENEGKPLSADDVIALYATFSERGIRCWVMGGWGVDALLGRESRPHHDLDLLLHVEDLAPLMDLLVDRGFSQKLIWQAENRWIEVQGAPQPTAFVQKDRDGRELDIHVVDVSGDGLPIALCDVPWQFERHSLTAVGVIAGTEVRCIAAETQLQMHTGYDLPPDHELDVERLRSFLGLDVGG